MSVIAPASYRAPDAAPDEIRVMVVDDAVVVRSLMSRWIEDAPGLKLVAALRNGREALDRLDQANPDVVLLDVEMPELDGISTLPRLLQRRRDLTVIMASALTRHHAEVTLKALALGAADYIPKPENEGGMMTSSSFQRELIEKIRALGARRRKHAPPTARRAIDAGGAAPCRRRPAARQVAYGGRGRRRAGRLHAARIFHCPAARAADRRIDRRAAGIDQAGVASRCRHENTRRF